MAPRHVRAYAGALTLLVFSGAWTVTAGDARHTTEAATAEKNARWDALVVRRQRLVNRAEVAREIIARRRAEADPSAVRIVDAPDPSSTSPEVAYPPPEPTPSTTTRSS